MRYIVELGLFTECQGRIFCLKLLKRINLSMASSASFRDAITAKKAEHHDTVMIHHDPGMGWSVGSMLPTLPTNQPNQTNNTPSAGDYPPPALEPTASPSANAVAKPPKPIDPLYQAIWQSFIAKTPVMANYKAQGAATHRLVAFIRQHSDKDDPDSAPELARQVVTKYWTMTQGCDKFWSKQPFTPMNLAAAGILDRVIQELRAVERQQEPDGVIPFF